MSVTEEQAKRLNRSAISIASGGENLVRDKGIMQAEDRAEMNNDLTNQVNRRIRPYYLGCRMLRISGW